MSKAAPYYFSLLSADKAPDNTLLVTIDAERSSRMPRHGEDFATYNRLVGTWQGNTDANDRLSVRAYYVRMHTNKNGNTTDDLLLAFHYHIANDIPVFVIYTLYDDL